MSLYGVSMIVSRIAVGLVLDRIHAPKVAMVIYCLPAIGLAALGLGHLPLAVFGMMTVGMIAAAEGDLLGFLTSRFFGLKSYSEIFGWLVSSFAAGGMVGASVVGLIYDRTQSYTIWLFAAAITSLVVGCLLGTLGKYRYVAPE